MTKQGESRVTRSNSKQEAIAGERKSRRDRGDKVNRTPPKVNAALTRPSKKQKKIMVLVMQEQLKGTMNMQGNTVVVEAEEMKGVAVVKMKKKK